jgi:membrane-associated phospholipid phosphatase
MKNINKNSPTKSSNATSRRQFLGNLGKAAVASTAVAAITPVFDGKSSVSGQTRAPSPESVQQAYRWRAVENYQLREEAARFNFHSTPPFSNRRDNGDENLYPNKIAGYSKGLPHRPNGEVVPSAYNALLAAVNAGKPNLFEQIPLGGPRRLVNPQAGLAFDLQGADAFSFASPPPPKFASREIAAEIAAADLTLFGQDFKGPKNSNGQVTPRLLFRGLTDGDRRGPLMSQFWYLPCFFGANEISQKIRTVKPAGDGGTDYLTDFNSWLASQNGFPPASGDVFDPVPRYIRSGRDLGEWVHVDVLFQAYFQAFLCLTRLGIPTDAGNPYRSSSNQSGFATFGPPHVAALLCEVSTRALKAEWNQKWFVHRRLRPEAFAARAHRKLYHGADYPIHAEILDSLSSGSRLGGYLPAGNALLPQAYPEGSPLHPSYGSGHAVVAGAAVTILKAWFNETAAIQNPVMPDASGLNLVPYAESETLTVGGELNKIASNVALGRNIAGIHWRSDGAQSLKLGEAVAISVLRDQKACYREQFGGFSLTKFDGTTVTV